MSGTSDDLLLDAAALAPGDDVLVLGGGTLVFGAHDRIGDGWVYVVRSQVGELEELLDEAHGTGSAGVAYLVGETPVLPLPDAAVAAAVGRIVVGSAAVRDAACELHRVLQPGGRLSLAASDGQAAGELQAALGAAGFLAGEAAPVGDETLVTARRP